MNYDYPEASYERRREIIKEHETYQKGWLYFIANDPRVPKDVQEEMQTWGLPKDEFTGQRQLAAPDLHPRSAPDDRQLRDDGERAAARSGRRPTPSAWAATRSIRTTCSATSRRKATCRTKATSASARQAPYEIAYGSLVPKRGQADNLLVPVCVSSSHIAFGSIRMEPVFMILGQSAATAAVMAIDAGIAVQDVPYAKLRERLLKDGQVLEYATAASRDR